MMSWDAYHIGMAVAAAKKSKDPSEQVGCVIVGPDGELRVSGFNGFAKKVVDLPARYADRDLKLKYMVHAEASAVSLAARVGSRLQLCTAYITKYPCNHCASLLINAGITKIVTPPMRKDSRWYNESSLARSMLAEAGVEAVEYGFDQVTVYDYPELGR